MISKEHILYWNEIEHDLYEENGHVFGVELDLFNSHTSFYCKAIENDEEFYQYLADDIFVAIEQFNEVLWLSKKHMEED